MSLALLAMLDEPTAFVAALSDDDFGRFVMDGLRQRGVDVSRVVVQPGRVSPLAFVAVDAASHGRTVFHTEGSIDALPAAAVDAEWLAGAKALLVDGQQFAAQLHACEMAKTLGIPIVLDAGCLREGFGDLVALADVLIGSERFATEIAPRGEIEDSLLEIAQMGPSVVVVTLGEEGAVGLEGQRVVRANALDVRVVDRSGASGAFRGAFVYAWLHNWGLEKCLQFATAAAGLKCQKLGSVAGLPSLDAIVRAAWGEPAIG